jgi:anti-sigma B factor antagonist
MTQDQIAAPANIPVHSPEHAIDITNSGDLRDAMLAQIEAGARSIVVDLSNVRYVDSSGLSSLVNVATTVETSGGHVILCGLDASVRKVLEMTRLTEYFEIMEDLESAIEKASEFDQASS